MSNDPFSHPGAWLNLPAVIILGLCTTILVIGIRESAASNTALVMLKLGVVIFVIIVGIAFVNADNWTRHSGGGARRRSSSPSPTRPAGMPRPSRRWSAQARIMSTCSPMRRARHSTRPSRAGPRHGDGLRQDQPPRTFVNDPAVQRKVSPVEAQYRRDHPAHRGGLLHRAGRAAPGHQLPATGQGKPRRRPADHRQGARRGGRGAGAGRRCRQEGGPQEMGHGRSDRHQPGARRGGQGDQQHVHALRHLRHHARRSPRVFRVHRLRLDFDAFRRSDQAAARCPHRHHRVARPVHGALHRRGQRHHRHGALSQHRHSLRGRVGIHRPGQEPPAERPAQRGRWTDRGRGAWPA